MWFTELAQVENPGRLELQQFVDAVVEFLDYSLKQPEMQFLWQDDQTLSTLARETFDSDVKQSAAALRASIPAIPQERLEQHGLIGRAMKFKFRVMDAIGRQWNRVRGQFTVREWFKRIVDAIDAALDSLIQAAGGVGGLLKEFKDALSALAETVP